VKTITIAAVCLILVGCLKSDFETFAYEGCLDEQKYSDEICDCNASKLDEQLTDRQKEQYRVLMSSSSLAEQLSASAAVLGPAMNVALQCEGIFN